MLPANGTRRRLGRRGVVPSPAIFVLERFRERRDDLAALAEEAAHGTGAAPGITLVEDVAAVHREAPARKVIVQRGVEQGSRRAGIDLRNISRRQVAGTVAEVTDAQSGAGARKRAGLLGIVYEKRSLMPWLGGQACAEFGAKLLRVIVASV